MIVLIAYEIAITFDREVELIWQKKIGNASVLFLVNRYLSLVVNSMYSPYPGSPGTQTVRVRVVQSINCINTE